jgi:hypothetical protein
VPTRVLCEAEQPGARVGPVRSADRTYAVLRCGNRPDTETTVAVGDPFCILHGRAVCQ